MFDLWDPIIINLETGKVVVQVQVQTRYKWAPIAESGVRSTHTHSVECLDLSDLITDARKSKLF